MPKKTDMKPRKEVDTSTYTGRFAVRLKTLREKAGYTVEEFAEALEVSLNTIYSWECGTNSPNVANFPKIAEVLKLKKTRDLFPNE